MDDISKALKRCAKCGTCRSVCPVFKESKDETLSTRGKLALYDKALKGDLTASATLRKILDQCLVCMKCKYKCPSLVETTELIRSAREWIGMPLLLKIGFRFIVPHRWLYDWTLQIADCGLRIYNKLFIRNNQARGITRHLPLALTDPFNKIPAIAKKTALSQASNSKPQIPNRRVGIFVGCLINYVYPEVYVATTNLLDKYGVSYVTPKDQLCCGTPLLLYGDRNNARRIARHNMKVFQREKVDAIITMCASCGRMLKDEYPRLQVTDCKLQVPIMDVMEFLSTVTSYPDIHRDAALFASLRGPSASLRNLKTTYHQPCHFTWTKAGEISRETLKEISDYKETDEENLCCGGGGAFTFKYPELSRQIGQHKIELLLKISPPDGTSGRGSPTAANIQTVVTGCPGCIMQLRYLLNSSGKTDINVKHITELLTSGRK
ncbi:MAG: (Fe-S)-binding protein [Planctomycetes bacterium]|nr:(Fe-S)-binding protein [Planctomycetota bacterium]